MHNLELEIKNYDKDNKLIYHMPRRESNSFVRNTYNGWTCSTFCNLNGDDSKFESGVLTVKRIDGNISSTNGSFMFGSTWGDAGYDTRGIVVGTSDTAESFEDYKLGSQVKHGNGAGQFYHAAQSQPLTYDTLVWTYSKERYFNNNSGGDITIKEVGLYALGNLGAGVPYLYCRDVLGTSVTVLNEGQLIVTYVLSFTFPE